MKGSSGNIIRLQETGSYKDPFARPAVRKT